MTSSAYPPVLSGALVLLGPGTQTSKTIVFQFNPDSLQRSLKPQTLGGDQGNRSQAVVFTAAPVEEMTVAVEIDAADQVKMTDAGMGIYPQLAALELLTYPSSNDVTNAVQQLEQGTLSVAPDPAPLAVEQQRAVRPGHGGGDAVGHGNAVNVRPQGQ